MVTFLTLSCPSCGAKLEVGPELDRFACGHCGSEHLVRRGGGTVSLAPVVAGIAKVQVGVDRTASELALQRLEREISTLRLSEEAKVKQWSQARGMRLLGMLLAVMGLMMTQLLGELPTAMGPVVFFIVTGIILGFVGHAKIGSAAADRKRLADQVLRTASEIENHRAMVKR